MALNPIEILKDTISSVLHKITISSVVSLGDSKYRLNTSNTLYLRTALAKKFITIDAVDYFVIDFELNTYLTVKATDGSDAPVTVSSFSIDPPLFVWGNPQMVSAELVKRVANGTVIWPYMWIVELGSTSGTLDPAAAVKETRNFNIFFLDSADKVNWTIEQHYDNDIYTLNNYIDFFFKILKSRRDLFETDSITYTKDNQVNFGDYIVDSGMKEHVLNGDITGIQLQVSIPYIVSSCAGVNVTPNCPVIVETFNGVSITSPVTQKAIVVQTDATTPAQTGNVLIDTDTQLTIEVPAVSVLKTVTFNQPHPAQDIVYDLYDAAWREANGEIPTLTTNQFTQQLGDTPWEIKYDDSDVTGITEHLFRLVGINGGYVIVDTDDTTKLYFDKDGVASNENDVFGKDGDHLMIDRLTGLACAYNNQKESGGGKTPSDFYDEMWNTDNFAGYTGEWFAMSIEEATTTLFQGTYRESLIQIWRDTDWFLFPGTLLLGSAYISTPTINIAAIGLIIYNFQAWARSNTIALGRFYVPFRRFDEWPLY